MEPSYFTFTFRLGPREHCLHLNFQDIKLAPEFKAVCIREFLGIYWVGDPIYNEKARGVARNLARALIHSHAYYSFPNGPLLEVEPETWLETRNCEAKESVYGNMHSSLATSPLKEGHEDNTVFLRAANLVGQLGEDISLRFALADFHVARRELGPYSAFYAYRVLEDVGFTFGITKDDKPDWDAMNKAFGTNKDKWQLLIESGTWARHLSEQSLAKLAGADRQQLLNLSHAALTLSFAHLLGAPPADPPS